MNFDLRFPLGILFSLYGLILVATGLTSTPAMINQSLGINMNLWWGLFQLLFGAIMLALALRKK
ncbi:MAG: hypothetical protein WCI38_02930 [Chthoniobacterales bacterium]|jgi:hypothetical protein